MSSRCSGRASSTMSPPCRSMATCRTSVCTVIMSLPVPLSVTTGAAVCWSAMASGACGRSSSPVLGAVTEGASGSSLFAAGSPSGSLLIKRLAVGCAAVVLASLNATHSVSSMNESSAMAPISRVRWKSIAGISFVSECACRAAPGRRRPHARGGICQAGAV